MCHIRKTTTCPTLPSVPYSRFPHVSHQVQKRPLTHFSLLMCYIRKVGRNIESRKSLLCKVLVHFEETGNDVGFGGVFREAVGLEDCGVVSAVGTAEFNWHYRLVV